MTLRLCFLLWFPLDHQRLSEERGLLHIRFHQIHFLSLLYLSEKYGLPESGVSLIQGIREPVLAGKKHIVRTFLTAGPDRLFAGVFIRAKKYMYIPGLHSAGDHFGGKENTPPWDLLPCYNDSRTPYRKYFPHGGSACAFFLCQTS